MIDSITTFEGRLAKIEGAAATGKTEALLRRAAYLVHAGVEPEGILIEATSGFAVAAMRARLIDLLPNDTRAQRVQIARAIDVCVDVLDSPATLAATGRVPRLLSQAEYKFFLEDMKTSGIAARKLRGMLRFFYREMSMLSPKDEWLGKGEEASVYAQMIRTLTMREAMLKEEAPTLCATFLTSEKGEHARERYTHVLCDDFQNLSYAEQTCMCLLARDQVIVAGNENETLTTGTAYPFAEGFARFEQRRRNVTVFTLTESTARDGITQFANALCQAPDMNKAMQATSVAATETEARKAPQPTNNTDTLAAEKTAAASEVLATADHAMRVIKWNTPDDEFDGLTKYLRVLFDASPDAFECRTCLVVPNKQWARAYEKVLARRGFAVSSAGTRRGLGGDPRERAKARAIEAYTKLNLLADETDLTAWRSWCGIDNYLTNSDAWARLENFAEAQGIGLLAALEICAQADDGQEPFLRAAELGARYRDGLSYIERNRARRGFVLLQAIGADKLADFAELLMIIDGDERASKLFEITRDYFDAPRFRTEKHCIHIALPDALAGTNYDNVLIAGAVDGYYPDRAAFEVVSTDEEPDRVLNRDRRAFSGAAAKASRHLVVSYFSQAPLELAERTKMQVARVRAGAEGERIAIARPTCFIGEAGNAAPSTIGGQIILTEIGLS